MQVSGNKTPCNFFQIKMKPENSYTRFVSCCFIKQGNDAIVAFSRRYEVVVVIHQLNEALWKIGDDDESVNLKGKIYYFLF